MPRVALLKVHDVYNYDGDSESELRTLTHEWEEVTKDELKELLEYQRTTDAREFGASGYGRIVVLEQLEAKPVLNTIRELLDKKRAEAETLRRKRESEAAKKAAKKLAKTEEERRKLFEALKQEFES